MTKAKNDFEYDVFVSYSHKDREWVQKWLLPKLESAGVRVFIDFRDLKLGAPLITELERAIARSRVTLLVLTPDYLASEWTMFENLVSSQSFRGDAGETLVKI